MNHEGQGRTGPTALQAISFARNPQHERFLLEFEGEIRGRYILAVLAGIGVLGSMEERKKVEQELGRDVYLPDPMYPAREYIFACDRAVRAGVSMVRVGELIFPAYKRAHPELFEGKSVVDALGMLEQAYRAETSWGGMSPPIRISGGKAWMFRKSQPAPCDLGVGVLQGLLRSFSVEGTVREADCQWKGSTMGCCLEVEFSIAV